MQDFFNLGDEEENAKLIWCIGKKKKKKIVILTKQTDTEIFQTNHCTLTQLGLNHSPLWTAAVPRGAMDGGMELFASTGWALWPDHMPHQA